MADKDYELRRDAVAAEAHDLQNVNPAIARALTGGKSDKLSPEQARAIAETTARDVDRGVSRPTRELVREHEERAARRRR